MYLLYTQPKISFIVLQIKHILKEHYVSNLFSAQCQRQKTIEIKKFKIQDLHFRHCTTNARQDKNNFRDLKIDFATLHLNHLAR